MIEIKDVQNRGGVDYFYRLHIGDFPLATTALPMAGRRGSKAKINFAGPAVDGVMPIDVEIPNDPAVKIVWIAPKGASGLYGWPVPLAVSDYEEARAGTERRRARPTASPFPEASPVASSAAARPTIMSFPPKKGKSSRWKRTRWSMPHRPLSISC